MTQYLKALGLALGMLLVVGAPAASAQNFGIFTEVKGAHITTKNEKTLDFGFSKGTLKCSVSGESGTLEVTELAEEEYEPIFTECRFGALEVQVKVDDNGCKVDYSEGVIELGNFEGGYNLKCTGTAKVEVTLTGCTVTVGNQTKLKNVTFTNINPDMGAKRELTIDVNVTGLSYTYDPVGGTPTCTAESRTDGTVTGSDTQTAEDATNKMVGLYVKGI